MCVFCKIVEGIIPSYKIYEDDMLIAILDISQTTMGHTLVIPKKHYDNILDAPDDVLMHLSIVVRDLAKKITKNLNAKGVNILNNTNEVAGQTVNHLHVHVIPRYSKDDSIKIEMHNNDFNLQDIFDKICQK